MDIERMTVRVQKSLNEAYQIAVKKHNQQVDVIHLFSALVNQEDGLIPNIFEKMNISLTALKSSIDEELNKLPQIDAAQFTDYVKLFSETNSRFVVEVPEEKASAFEALFNDSNVVIGRIGKVTEAPRLKIVGDGDSVLVDSDVFELKRLWQKPFDLGGEYTD